MDPLNINHGVVGQGCKSFCEGKTTGVKAVLFFSGTVVGKGKHTRPEMGWFCFATSNRVPSKNTHPLGRCSIVFVLATRPGNRKNTRCLALGACMCK